MTLLAAPLKLSVDSIADELCPAVRPGNRVNARQLFRVEPNERCFHAKRRTPHSRLTIRYLFSCQAAHKAISPIDRLTDNAYIGVIGYGGK